MFHPPACLRTIARLCLLLGALLVLAACGAPAAPGTSTPDDRPTAPEAAPPTATTPPSVPDPTLAADLAAHFAQTVPTVAPETGRVQARPLPGGGPQRWVAHTTGLRSFDPPVPHVIALFERDGAQWRELGRLDLPSDADYLDEQAVQPTSVAPGRLWLTVESGIGAHGGCFDLLSYDGTTLRGEASGCGASPGGSTLADINGDDIQEVLLDQSDPYVFCYACGVRDVHFQLLAWDGQQMREVTLTPAAPDAPAEVGRAILLAEAGLWKQASEAIAALPQPTTQDGTGWNIALIRALAEAKNPAGREGGYPLLAHLFYGDYRAALATVRGHTATEIFNPNSPLIVGTPAEGWTAELSQRITSAASAALPLLDGSPEEAAAAHFLRAWATFLVTPTDPAILTDLEAAAALTPTEPLYTESIDLVAAGLSGSAPNVVLPAPLLYLHPEGQIARLAQDGATEEFVTREVAPITDFDLSPIDGALVYVSGNDLIRTDALGGGRTVLVDGPPSPNTGAGPANRLAAPRWSPDGTTIAYGLNGVNLIAASGGTPRLVRASSPAPAPNSDIPPDVRFYQPHSWSPDGTILLAHMSFFPHGGTLVFMDPASGDFVEVQNPEGDFVGGCCSVAWSADSRAIVYANHQPGMISVGLWRTDARTGETTTLVQGNPAAGGSLFTPVGFPAPAPDEPNSYLLFMNELEMDRVLSGAAPIELSPWRITIRGNDLTRHPLSTERSDIHEALWALDGSGAVIVENSTHAFETGGPLLWLPADGAPARPLGGFGRLLRWAH